MICHNCGNENENGVAYCVRCGAPMNAEQYAQQVPQQVPQAPQQVPQAPQAPQAPFIPEEYKPLSPWAYFGYSLLFSIPLVGFICLIIFAFDKSNINRRNFVLGQWIGIAVGVALYILLVVLLIAVGFTMADLFEEMMYY